MSYDVGDPIDVRKRKKKFELDIELKNEELKALLEHRYGRAVIWRILELCGLYTQSFQGEPIAAVYREGSRKVGLQIREMFHELGSAGDHYWNLMTDEAMDQQRKLNTDG